MAPDPEVGREFSRPVKAKHEITPLEVFEKVKGKTVMAGEKALEMGGKAYHKIQEKIVSGELKEGAKNVGEAISTKAKGIWDTLSTKVNGMRESKKEEKGKEKESEEMKVEQVKV